MKKLWMGDCLGRDERGANVDEKSGRLKCSCWSIDGGLDVVDLHIIVALASWGFYAGVVAAGISFPPIFLKSFALQGEMRKHSATQNSHLTKWRLHEVAHCTWTYNRVSDRFW